MKKHRPNKNFKMMQNDLDQQKADQFLKESADFIWKQVLPVEGLDDALSENYNKYIIAYNDRKYWR